MSRTARTLLGLMLLALCAAASARAQDPLIPDMRTNPLPTSPFDYELSAGEFSFTNGWANQGQGPWETEPAGPAGDEDCDGDGDPLDDQAVNQNIYEDANGNNVFDRGIDTTSQAYPSGCMIYHDHPDHDHFHINDAGEYTLISEATGQQVGESNKVSFCLLDVAAFNTSLPGAPATAYYEFCTPTIQGISVGWFDEYHYSLEGQSISIAGAPAGNYCLQSRFDPLNRFIELNETNNLAEQRYYMNPATGQVLALSGPCFPQSPAVADTDSPETIIKGGPRGRTHDRTPTFRFKSDEAGTLRCRLDDRLLRSCNSPKNYQRLGLGRHVFVVRATDLAANKDPSAAKRHFRVVD